ncbi:MAG: M23 family metallopeptidase [Proteobacteria bacterium]|nr:M23 family metallopeptidase [Pseudomonadota bacterium]MCG2829555.1 M23 family metallopeptidase [Desulfobacteraceae bacterium]MBU4012006.1 M23 family metallopeptidase [Pseudomonadota bacterium]MBU4066774.1 M23 family metallopeptidase [Pseudomonadota bacterium]MBU4102113.1 M23 family metallopeptidase [Pseudomonadota bacterium]
MRTKEKKSKHWLIALLCIIIILPITWILFNRFEGGDPSIKLDLLSQTIGASQELSISVADTKSGLRRVWIGLLQNGRETILLEKDFPAKGLISRGIKHEEALKVKIDPGESGIKDGKAILRIVASDYSWRRWFKGNLTYLEKNIIIDTKPPGINIISRFHNISQGGACLVIYKLSEQCDRSGVYVEENFFPGYSGHFQDKNILMAFFALNHKQEPVTKIFIEAIDSAGNTSKAGFNYNIKRKVFKKDVINISDKFLNWKMPEFDIYIPQPSELTIIDKFLKVNQDIRKDSYNKVIELAENTDKVLYWDGVFLRLPKSANKAGFADNRVYQYKNEIIDRQIHLGIDLASLAHSPVQAANKGKVVFAGSIGIYGKTVIIDHGFGLHSMYAHLSSYNVEEKQMVSKGEIIGITGITGLAGGDHLHYSILIHNTFVNPVEWWDKEWIKNNISSKIDDAKEN